MDKHCRFELVDEHSTDESERLARMALQHGLPAHLVEDIVHEVCVQLMEDPPEFATQRAARSHAWLRWVLRNKVVDALRHLGGQQQVSATTTYTLDRAGERTTTATTTTAFLRSTCAAAALTTATRA